MNRADTLARLRAYAAAHPTDVEVVVETTRATAELDAYAVLGKLSAAWRRGRSRAQRLHLLATHGVDTTDCRIADLQRAIKRQVMRDALEEGLRRSMTRTQTGLGGAPAAEPSEEEAIPLVRILPPPSSPPVSGVRARAPLDSGAVERVARYFQRARRTGDPHGAD